MVLRWCIKIRSTAAPWMAISIVLNIARAVCAGNLEQRAPLQVRRWSYDDIVYVGSTDHQIYALLA